MASLLLPPAKEAADALKDSIQPSIEAGLAMAGYGTKIAIVTTNIAKATATIIGLQAVLSPLGATQPPFVIGVNNCVAAITQFNLITASIPLATAQSVALAGAPSPSFIPSAALVTKQIEEALEYVTDFLVKPQE